MLMQHCCSVLATVVIIQHKEEYKKNKKYIKIQKTAFEDADSNLLTE